MRLNFKSFTLVEISVVVVLSGIIAAFSISSLRKVHTRAIERQMVLQMKTLQTLIKAHEVRYGNVPIVWPEATDLDVINQSLNTDLKPINNATYTYSSATGSGYRLYIRADACQISGTKEREICSRSTRPGVEGCLSVPLCDVWY